MGGKDSVKIRKSMTICLDVLERFVWCEKYADDASSTPNKQHVCFALAIREIVLSKFL